MLRLLRFPHLPFVDRSTRRQNSRALGHGRLDMRGKGVSAEHTEVAFAHFFCCRMQEGQPDLDQYSLSQRGLL